MRFGNAVKLVQVAFGLIPKILNSVNVVLLPGKMRAVIDAKMRTLTHVQHAITAVTIGVNNTVRLHLLRIIGSNVADCVLGTATV